MGAALMAAHACLRTGAGLTTVNIPGKFLNALHAHLPEAMCALREDEPDLEKITSIGIGPGLGTGKGEKDLVVQTLKEFKYPMVIDADALNILSEHKDWLQRLPAETILTPHPKEFERLFDFFRIDIF